MTSFNKRKGLNDLINDLKIFFQFPPSFRNEATSRLGLSKQGGQG